MLKLKVICFRDLYRPTVFYCVYLILLSICLPAIPNSLWSYWPISRLFDRAAGESREFSWNMINGKRKWGRKKTPPMLNHCMQGGSTSRHKSPGNQSIRLVALFTELLLHHKSIKKHLLEAFTASEARFSVNQRLYRQLTNHTPPNVKVRQLLCFYSHIKWIILILELTEQTMSLPKFILPNSDLSEGYTD